MATGTREKIDYGTEGLQKSGLTDPSRFHPLFRPFDSGCSLGGGGGSEKTKTEQQLART